MGRGLEPAQATASSPARLASIIGFEWTRLFVICAYASGKLGCSPTSRLARLACLLLGIDILLFGLQAVLGAFIPPMGTG